MMIMMRRYLNFLSALVCVLCTACEHLPDAGSVNDLPEMYSSYLDTRVAAVQEAIKETEGNYECFFWITDIHWEPDLNTRNSPAMIKYLAERTGIDKILNGGDTGNADVICDNAINRLRDAIGSDRVYTVTGNHEITDASKYERPFRRVDRTLRGHCKDLVYGDDDHSYFYFDDAKVKTRYIGLSVFGLYRNNLWDQALNSEQLDWLKNVALNVNKGWGIVIFLHTLYDINVFGVNEDSDKLLIPTVGAENCINIIEKYNGEGEILCVFTGHTHRDRLHRGERGVPYIISACDRHASYYVNGISDINVDRVPGSLSEQHFEVVVIDKTHKKVRLFSIGAPARDGIDDEPGELTDERVISYERQ